MKHLKKFEKQLKYELGDYVIPIGENPKDSYTVISEVRGGSFSDYMVSTYKIYSGNRIEHFPIMEYEIVRKMTPKEIEGIEIKKNTKKYNI
jgi:hypothetical protein